jgi:sulfur-oxidizing protein SoxA
MRLALRALCSAAIVGFALAGGAVQAQDNVEKELEKYRQMMKADPFGNPGLLDADRGEALWKAPKGPNKATLEQCDLGKGPGVVEGAFAELPRYFPDVDRVMDAEARILHCMETLQGFDSKDFRKNPHPGGGARVKDVGAIATWVASKSHGNKFDSKVEHPKEKDAVALGEALFNRRQGPFDFACTTCHADAGRRIRLQPLPFLSQPDEARKVMGEWPAYRVSSTHVMTMQHRLLDCFWQMRLHRLDFGSEASIALTAYLNDKARGGEITAPNIKR